MSHLVQRLSTSLLAVGLVASVGLPYAAQAQTGCATSGEGVSCFGGEYYCAAAQSCRAPVTTCPRTAEALPGPLWSYQVLSCAACGCSCPAGYSRCGGGANANFCVTNRACPAGLTWDVCTDTCMTPYVLLDPATAQAGSVKIGGGVMANGDVSTGGDVYMGNGKALRVDGTGETSLNLGNWGSGGAGVNLNVLGDLGNTGTASFSKETHIGKYNHVLDYASSTTPTYGYKIKTNIPFQNSMQMPTVLLDGYMFGAGKAMRIAVSWYVFGDAFYNVSAASGGGYQPTIQLARENGMVVIYLTPPVYYIRFHISAYEFMGTTKEMFEGWTVVDEALTGDKVMAVPYTQSLSGDSYFTSGIWNSVGNVGIGTTTPTAKLQVNPTTNTEGLRIISSNYSPFVIRNAANTADIFRIDETGKVTISGGFSGTVDGTGTANYTARWSDTDTLAAGIIFDNGTNVGIGTNAPTQKLTVNGSLAFTPTNPYISAPSYAIIPGGAYFNSLPVYTEGTIRARGGINSDTTATLNIFGGLSGNTYMSGNLGLGTTTPGAKVTAVAGATDPSTYDDGKALFATVGTGGPNVSIAEFRHDNLSQGVGIGYASVFATGYNASQDLAVFARGTGNLLLNSYGGTNVGVGTNAPTAKLQVNPVTGGEGVRIISSNFSPLVIRNTANTSDLFRVNEVGDVTFAGRLQSTSCVGHTFVGLTSAAYTPAQVVAAGGGYSVVNGYCNAAFAGSHVCRNEEMLESFSCAKTGDPILNSILDGTMVYVNGGPPGYTAFANDCYGWQSSANDKFARIWTMNSAKGGVGAMVRCDVTTSQYFACCR